MKYDGYRGLLYVEQGKGRLISRNSRTMKRFGALAWALVPLITWAARSSFASASTPPISSMTDRV